MPVVGLEDGILTYPDIPFGYSTESKYKWKSGVRLIFKNSLY